MILGIDLGTTNSAAAIWRDGAARLIPNRLGETLTPSAVSIDDSGSVIVGRAARERQASHPDATATAFKRFMGSRHVTTLAGRRFTPEELSALVLRSLKEDAETLLGAPVTEAVITVPAYFNDKQRKATRRAGELAGLKVERLINEPTAAALAYGIHELGAETRFLVFDLGGGTFDVSVLEIFEGIIEVRSSTGDNRLGGEDFNDVLIAMLRARFASDWGHAAEDDVALYQKLREAAERGRRALTSANATTLAVAWRDREYAMEVTAEAFETAAAELIARLRDPVQRAVRDSNIRSDALDEIILIGGATRMPIVRRAVARMFGRFPNASVNPDEAVAIGAAVQAGLKARDAALREVVLTDVCPYSLGIASARRLRADKEEWEHGLFSPIIERNTVLPVSRVRSFGVFEDDPVNLSVAILQGEARLARDNIEIGTIKIQVPQHCRQQGFECRFSYDINGLLEVDVHVIGTGERFQAVITDPDDTMSADEIERRRAALAALKVHPRDSEASRALLARADRCWQDFLGHRREQIDAALTQFNRALDTQDARIVDRARSELVAVLDSLEGPAFL